MRAMNVLPRKVLSFAQFQTCADAPGKFIFFLLGFLLFLSGCAGKQPAPPPPEPARVQQAFAEPHQEVLRAARSSTGVPYKYGAASPEIGFDCSGLVYWAYQHVGVNLPRRAKDQANFGTSVRKEDIRPGDIVVFKGVYGRSGWHCGIYTGNGMFVHSPSKGKTVTETSLDSKYFAKRFFTARRISLDDNRSEGHAVVVNTARSFQPAINSAEGHATTAEPGEHAGDFPYAPAKSSAARTVSFLPSNGKTQAARSHLQRNS